MKAADLDLSVYTDTAVADAAASWADDPDFAAQQTGLVIELVTDLLELVRRERETCARLCDEVVELRRECFDLSAQLSVQKTLVSTLEDVVKATQSMRGRA